MNSSSETIKLTRWTAPRKNYTSPLILHKGRLISDKAECALILRYFLLALHLAIDYLPPCTLTADKRIPWSNDVTETEVRICTIGSKITCPGADGISTDILAARRQSIGKQVTTLFQACLRIDHHPTCFKLAKVVLLPRYGRDPSSIKGCRPKALLSCLRKGLERLIAKRMSHLAIVSGIVGHQQFRALLYQNG